MSPKHAYVMHINMAKELKVTPKYAYVMQINIAKGAWGGEGNFVDNLKQPRKQSSIIYIHTSY